MPEGKMSKWERIVEIIHGANKGNKSYALKTTADVETLSAVSDALKAQVTKRLEAVEASLQSDDQGKRALASKEKEARELDELMQDYEAVLGEALDDLRERAEEAEAAAALAILSLA